LTFRLCVVYCLPSAIRLEESIAPDIVSAMDTTQALIGLILCLTPVMAFLTQLAFVAKHCHWIHTGRPGCRNPGRQYADKSHQRAGNGKCCRV
jgi:hypothetical protein